jgi:ubiquinone/menaquinone biosynthesis C-methylase UbiE
MTDQSSYEKWKSLQSHWDDDEFLKSLTPLMKLRYGRLDEKVLRLFEKAFQNSERPLLVDLGAGRGEFAFFLSKQGKAGSWNYLGVEPSAEQLNQRDIQNLGLGFIRATAERMPLQDMIAEGVLMKEALDHCYDPSKVFQEAKRLLKPGGLLVVTLTNDRSYFKRLLPWVNRAHKAKQTDHLFFFGPTDLKKLAEDAQFDSVSVETYNYLKLPRLLEKLLGLLGPRVCSGLLDLGDVLGKAVLPGWGGGIILQATLK